MLEKIKEHYLVKTIPFRSLPDDLQTAIIQKIITGIFLGIVSLSFGLCSNNLTILLLLILFTVINMLTAIMPYFLATRNILIQVSGIGLEKKTHGIENILKLFLIELDSNGNRVQVNVSKKIYKSFHEGIKISIYALPKNIQQNTAGIYIIANPLLISLLSSNE